MRRDEDGRELYDPYDARGVRIEPGDRVVYGAGVGRSIEMVEARVRDENPFTATGRVRLQVVSRSFGGFGTWHTAETVAVRPDRLVVVTELPDGAPTRI